MDRYEFQKIRKQPPTLHWDSGNRFENIQRLRWENAALESPHTSFLKKQFLTQRGYWHCCIAFGTMCIFYPIGYYAWKKVFPETQDFRNHMTQLRLLGGLEEKDYYVMERFKAIERAKARAAML